jgi:triosephosphate isomerase
MRRVELVRKPIIAGNWKMHKTVGEAVELVQELVGLVRDVQEVEVVVCPVFTSLGAVRERIKDTNIKLGAQNMHWEKQGAFTGEVSPGMLKDVGCDYVIVGHSERRQYFAETDETVNHKVKAAFANALIPIMCVGETFAARQAGDTESIIERQVRKGLNGISSQEAAAMVIAYEPIWAIGTGVNASAEDANAVCAFIRNLVKDMFGVQAADSIRIQYGGSVKPENVAELMAKSDIDGALVGGASLNANFSKIVKF